jgi:hypothetical protein
MLIRSSRLVVPALVITVVLLGYNRAVADECSDILKPELLSKSTNQRAASYSEAARNWACNATVDEIKTAGSTANSGSDIAMIMPRRRKANRVCHTALVSPSPR